MKVIENEIQCYRNPKCKKSNVSKHYCEARVLSTRKAQNKEQNSINNCEGLDLRNKSLTVRYVPL